jgi:hypothetical protein
MLAFEARLPSLESEEDFEEDFWTLTPDCGWGTALSGAIVMSSLTGL